MCEFPDCIRCLTPAPYALAKHRFAWLAVGILTFGMLTACRTAEVTDTAPTRSATIQTLSRAWQTADAPLAASVATSAPSTTTAGQLADAALNVRALGLTEVSLVPEDRAAERARLTWRLPGATRPASVVLAIEWRTSSRGPTVAGIASDETTIPLWVLERLKVRTDGEVLVTGGTGGDLSSLLADAMRARARVADTFPNWERGVVIEAPSNSALLAETLAAPRAAYDDVAAVTTSADGTIGLEAGQRVLVHPVRYPAMDRASARLVMTHEVTHVASRSATSTLPLWWSEGLAEFVAFSTAPPADRALAEQLLAQAREALAGDLAAYGPPEDLPDSDEFSGGRQDAAYESSRRAVALLSRLASTTSERPSAGVEALWEFQTQLASGREVEQALPAVFGVTYEEFIRAWQQVLPTSTSTP